MRNAYKIIFNGSDISSRGLLDCDAVYLCGRIPTFRRSMLPLFSGWNEDGDSVVLRNVGIPPQHYTVSEPSEDGGSKALRNVGIPPHHYTVSQPRRLRL